MKFRKIYLIIISIITLLCVAAGLLIYCGPVTLEDIRKEGLPGALLKEREEYNAYTDVYKNASDISEFQNISANIEISNLTFRQGNAYSVAVNTEDRIKPSFYVKNQTLYIEQKRIRFYEIPWFHSRHQKNQIIVTVPAGKTLSDCHIESDIGNVEMNDITAETLDCSLDTGTLSAENVQAKSSRLDLDTGDVSFRNSDLGNLKLTCDTGDVTMTDTKAQDVDISCDTGDVNFSSPENADQYYYQIESDLGDVRLNGTGLGRHYTTEQGAEKHLMKVSCSMGDVDLKMKTY